VIDLKKKQKNKGTLYRCRSFLGFASPLLESLLGTFIILILAYLLNILGCRIENNFLFLTSQFLIYKLHYFLALSILFNYNCYFSNHFKESYFYFSPIPNAFSAFLMVWIISHLFNTLNIYSKLQPLQDFSNILYSNIFHISLLILILGYIHILMIKLRGKF
jgi:hypothetical protein